MSSGDHAQISGKDAPVHAVFLLKLMDNPRVVAGVRGYTKADDSHDVPFVGASNEAGDTVYLDKAFAQAVKDGKVKYDGKPFDPTPFIKLHEAIEGACIRHLHCNYDTDNKQGLPGAHLIASWAEHRAVVDSGLDWDKYQAALKPWIAKDAREKVENPPTDLVKTPKLSHAAVHYGKSTGKDRCDGCQHHIDGKPLHCELVADPIAPDGWCEKFERAKGEIMARLTTAGREHIAPGNFALPGRRYPIEDPAHARNALARVSQFGSPEEKAEVRARVHSKYPGIGHSEGGFVPNPQAGPMPAPVAPPANPGAAMRHHALSVASATHLHNAGHLPANQAAAIKQKARANIDLLKRAQPQPQPMAFGSLAPALGAPQGGPQQ